MAALVETLNGSADIAGEESQYSFEPLELKVACMEGRENSDKFIRWGLQDTLKIRRFRFCGGGAFDPATPEGLLAALFSDPSVVSSVTAGGSSTAPHVAGVGATKLRTTALSMKLFDPLKAAGGPIAENGYILKCLDECYQGVMVQDKLREMFLNDDESSELAAFMPPGDTDGGRDEFLFQLFRLLVVGGTMCQPDEYATEYFATVREMYKGLVSVYRKSEGGGVYVASHAYEIKELEGANFDLFSQRASKELSRCYVLVDPLKKHATVLCCPHLSFW